MNKNTLTLDQAREAHILCCPYYTKKMGEPASDGLQKTYNYCGAGHRYCDGNCWYLSHFNRVLKKLISSGSE